MAKKTPDKTASKTASVALAPAPPQGGARLPLGAHPGNTGGKVGRSGPRTNIVRQQAQDGVALGVRYSLGILRSRKAEHRDKMDCAKFCNDVADPLRFTRTQIQEILQEQNAIIRGCEFITLEEQDELLQRIWVVWRKL